MFPLMAPSSVTLFSAYVSGVLLSSNIKLLTAHWNNM